MALLAILKAGGAYVPLDPDYPTDRLAYMLADARVTTLLTQSSLLERLPAAKTSHFCLDSDWSRLEAYADDNLELEIQAENLAYMIYTSGSTGRPKGVQISHANLLNLVYWHRRTYNVQPEDRATQLAGIAFDACVWEIWPYLTAGASLYLPDASTRLDPEQLRDWLVNEHITLSFMPTPMAEGVLTLAWPETTALRALLTGGDKLHYYPSDKLPFRLINHYGPTEFTVVTSAGDVPVGAQEERAPSIGKPIANTQIYVLDKHLQLVPQGVPGELFVGGASLARGYLQRADLTAELFVTHPFSTEPGARLYRTGDLVRYLPDGSLEFLGRIDAQVKIRGYRIEPGEIEAILLQHQAIRDCSVILHEDKVGNRRLVAYLVAQENASLDREDIRAYLQEQVPDYMVPAVMVILEALPLTRMAKLIGAHYRSQSCSTW
ncbi:hypothetical protein KDW_43490 [Dictyobacter vulcani]|uniref:AMP-dependent synthetase/ligase domain-containing protein n=1 Tax=Dictyobacter vulcani TaxID=2607529 RepID=A0A5J4KUN9_9CHLR|nr:hypothetical protein KDW_43490 [Dictyobacter vulcani]